MRSTPVSGTPDRGGVEVRLVEPVVLLEGEVDGEPLGEEYVAQHAPAIPGVPPGRQTLLDVAVFRPVADGAVVQRLGGVP